MGAKDAQKAQAVGRIWESVIASVTGGLILWSVTSSSSQPVPTAQRMAFTLSPATQPIATPYNSALAEPTISELPHPRPQLSLSSRPIIPRWLGRQLAKPQRQLPQFSPLQHRIVLHLPHQPPARPSRRLRCLRQQTYRR